MFTHLATHFIRSECLYSHVYIVPVDQHKSNHFRVKWPPTYYTIIIRSKKTIIFIYFTRMFVHSLSAIFINHYHMESTFTSTFIITHNWCPFRQHNQTPQRGPNARFNYHAVTKNEYQLTTTSVRSNSQLNELTNQRSIS